MWKRIFARRTRDAELDEELQAHIDIEAKRLADEGMSREAAAAYARRAFGSRALIAELTRESWGAAWWTGIRRARQPCLPRLCNWCRGSTAQKGHSTWDLALHC